MFQPGKLVPNVTVTTLDGTTHSLWDYRQTAHLILIHDPSASPETRRALQAEVEAHAKTWAWLQARAAVVAQAPAEMPTGATVIDRYGTFLGTFPLDANVWERVEKELIYNDAKHC